MAELQGKKKQQPSSCPEGWTPAAIVVQLELTCRQERYAKRSVGIARFVYNRLVANDQAGRDAGLWLTPYELEKELNAAKRTNHSLGFVTQVSKFVAQGACRNHRNAHARWRNKDLKAHKPAFHKKRRTGHRLFPRSLRNEVRPVRQPPAHTCPLPGQRQDDPDPPEGNPLRSHDQETQRPLVR